MIPQEPRFGSLQDHALWASLALLLALLAAGYYVELAPFAFHTTGQSWLGAAAALGFLTAFAYAGRKRLGLRRFQPIRPWYVAHVWLTACGFAVALLHADFSLGGPLEATLLVGYAVNLAGGLALALFHRRFQSWMSGLEREHLLPEDIIEGLDRRTHEIADLMAASAGPTAHLIESQVLLPLARPAVLWRLRHGRGVIEQLRAARNQALLPRLRTLGAAETEVVARALTAELERRSLELQALLHRLRSAALTAHTAVSMAVLGLLAAHVMVVLVY